jgi:rSAM/selenodomain-associated transferase 1
MSTLVIFAKAPVLGAVKPRLAKSVGETAALALYEAFLDDTCLVTQGLGARRVLAVDGDLELPALARIAKSHRLTLSAQGDGDLGTRMGRAIADAVARGPVLLLAADVPTLPRPLLHRALDALMEQDVVVGPADDGGLYLLGARVPIPELLAEMPWSTPAVESTLVGRLWGWPHLVLPRWYDVDEPPELERLRAELAGLPPSTAPATRRALAGVLGSPP